MVLKEVFGIFKHQPSSPVTALITLAFLLFYAIPLIPAFTNFCKSGFTMSFLKFPIAII